MADHTPRPRRSDGARKPSERGRVARSRLLSQDQVKLAVWEREMRRLRLIMLGLSAVMVALVARAIVAGVTTAIVVTAAIIAGLLVASLVLARQGRRLAPPPRVERHPPPDAEALRD